MKEIVQKTNVVDGMTGPFLQFVHEVTQENLSRDGFHFYSLQHSGVNGVEDSVSLEELAEVGARNAGGFRPSGALGGCVELLHPSTRLTNKFERVATADCSGVGVLGHFFTPAALPLHPSTTYITTKWSTDSKGESSARLSRIYYNPRGYWKGWAAVKKLARAAKVAENVAKEWLTRQALWQVYLPAPRRIPRPKFDIPTPNAAHQADLLFMPQDKDGRKIFKYALTVVDVASRFKEAKPLTSKNSDEVAWAFEKIYKHGPLKWPKML